MKFDPGLERYLTSLEDALKPFPVSDRAEIITEIKSHILLAMEKDPKITMSAVLAALGEPEIVANRYLMERGLKPTKPPISPIVKWLIVGFLGTVAMVLVFFGFLISRFLPLVHVSDLQDKVSFMGGLIEIDDENGRVTVNGNSWGNGQSWSRSNRKFEGSTVIEKGQKISLKFSNGKLSVNNSSDNKLTWNCRVHGSQSTSQPVIDSKNVTLDLSKNAGAKCDLSVPKDVSLDINGANGKIDIDEPHFNLIVQLGSGLVSLIPDKDSAYRYNLSATNGTIDSFDSSDKADAYSVTIQLANGKITREK